MPPEAASGAALAAVAAGGRWRRLPGLPREGARLLRGAGGALLVSAAAVPIGLAVQVLIARLLGVEQFGLYALVMTAVMVLAVLAKLGLQPASVRYVSAYVARADWRALRGFLRWSARASMLAALTLSLAVLAAAHLGARYGVATHASAWLVGAVLLPLVVRAQLQGAVLRALRRVLLAEMSQKLAPRILIGTGALALLASGANAVGAPVMLALAACAWALLGLWLGRSARAALPAPARGADERHHEREWLRTALPLLVTSGAQILLKRTDVLMLGGLLGPAAVAPYVAAVAISELALAAIRATNVASSPMLSELHACDQREALRRVVALESALVLVASAVLAAGALAAGPVLLAWYGEGFDAGYTPLVLLVAGTALSALLGPVGAVMTMTGHQRAAMRLIGVTLALNAALNLLLVPAFGAAGAAAATATSTLLGNACMYAYVTRRMGIPCGAGALGVLLGRSASTAR